jgi:hypothetical protein
VRRPETGTGDKTSVPTPHDAAYGGDPYLIAEASLGAETRDLGVEYPFACPKRAVRTHADPGSRLSGCSR